MRNPPRLPDITGDSGGAVGRLSAAQLAEGLATGEFDGAPVAGDMGLVVHAGAMPYRDRLEIARYLKALGGSRPTAPRARR